MPDLSFAQQITAAARVVARLELKRRKYRQHLADLDAEYREAQRQLRLLVQSTEPYTPPTAESIATATSLLDERP